MNNSSKLQQKQPLHKIKEIITVTDSTTKTWSAQLIINKNNKKITLTFEPGLTFNELNQIIISNFLSEVNKLTYFISDYRLERQTKKCKCTKKGCSVRKTNNKIILTPVDIEVDNMNSKILDGTLIKIAVDKNDDLWAVYSDANSFKQFLFWSYSLTEAYVKIASLPDKYQPICIYKYGNPLKLYDVLISPDKLLNDEINHLVKYRLSTIEVL